MKFNSGLVVRATSLFGLEALHRRGTRPLVDLMRETGVPLDALKRPDSFVPFASNIALLELAAQEWDRPNIGLEWTLNLPKSYPNIGPIIFLARFINSTEEWIETALEYAKAQTNSYEVIVERNNGFWRAIYKVNSYGWPGRQLIEHAVSGICFGVRVILNNFELKPIEVQFTHSKPQTPNYDALLDKIFGCEVKFDCAENAVTFDSSIFDIQTDKSLGIFRYILRSNIQKRLEKMPRINIRVSNSVEHAIKILMGIGKVKFETVAELLDIAPKTLQRMLHAENETFSAIFERVRQNSAQEMLIDTNLSVAQIAKCLDYSSNPAFTLAFKRWHNISPAQYRRNQKVKA